MKWLVVFFVFSGIILSSFQYNANSVLVEQIESNFPIVILSLIHISEPTRPY